MAKRITKSKSKGADSESFRGRLSRALILKQALQFIDAEGMERLSMRELASKLGVEAMSLYRHVQNKEDLIAGVVDLIYQEIELPDPEVLDWKAWLREMTLRQRSVFLMHPAMAQSSFLYTRRSSAGLTILEGYLANIERSGLTGERAYHAYHLLGSFVLGTMLQEALLAQYARQVARSIHETPADHAPVSARYVEFLLGHNREREFEYGLDAILDSIEREVKQADVDEPGTRSDIGLTAHSRQHEPSPSTA